jgi:selenocysteine lyase/cysteine desulfurase
MASTPNLALLREREFARLDATGSIYLDHTGAALYPASLVIRDARRLVARVLGNPHSESAPSRASTSAMQKARRLTLRFLDADPALYDVVFTANASAAIRILADAFPFRTGSRLVMTADNHNSVNGLRVPARRRRSAVEYVPCDSELRGLDPLPWLTKARAPSLFAFPAQSNFSGVRHPLGWVSQAQRQGYRVLLDAASYASTSPLSLSEVPADFVALSFYKLFGYPTGLGALIAKREALATLKRGYFGGGAVQFASVQNRLARIKPGAEGFEDGTPNFLAMPAICDGLEWLRQIGMERIQNHVACLTEKLLRGLTGLGDRICLYGPRDARARGGIVTFNLRRGGRVLPFEMVEAAARDCGIAIRGGCFCNPGAAEHAFGIPAGKARACLRGDFTVAGLRACLGDRAVGAVRASMGIATSMRDLDSLLDFAVRLTSDLPGRSARTNGGNKRSIGADRLVKNCQVRMLLEQPAKCFRRE